MLEGTCNTVTSEDSCVGVMDWMSTQIVRSDVCMQDLREKNSIALEALYGELPPFLLIRLNLGMRRKKVKKTDEMELLGFRSYDLYRKAGCLVNPRTNAYCMNISFPLLFHFTTHMS